MPCRILVSTVGVEFHTGQGLRLQGCTWFQGLGFKVEIGYAKAETLKPKPYMSSILFRDTMVPIIQ